MAWEMFGWQPVSDVMEGRDTVSAGPARFLPGALHSLWRPADFSLELQQTT